MLRLGLLTGAHGARAHGLGPVHAVIVGAITGIGGGMLRDILLGGILLIGPSSARTCPWTAPMSARKVGCAWLMRPQGRRDRDIQPATHRRRRGQLAQRASRA
jgi:hypothetical protein